MRLILFKNPILFKMKATENLELQKIWSLAKKLKKTHHKIQTLNFRFNSIYLFTITMFKDYHPNYNRYLKELSNDNLIKSLQQLNRYDYQETPPANVDVINTDATITTAPIIVQVFILIQYC